VRPPARHLSYGRKVRGRESLAAAIVPSYTNTGLAAGDSPTTLLHKGKDAATEYFPRVHRVASLLKRWLMGTHHSYVADHYLDYYLDEFTFRFNRRTSRSPGKLFHRLLFQAVREAPTPLDEIVREAANHNRLGVVE
jgi:ISXO2-like transposase domain